MSLWTWTWVGEHEQGSKTKSFKKYSITPRIKYLVTWKNIFPHVTDEWYLWMKMWMKNDNGWTFSWTFTTNFVLQKTEQKKQDIRNLCWFIVNNSSHEMLKLYWINISYSNFATFKPYKIWNYIKFNGT